VLQKTCDAVDVGANLSEDELAVLALTAAP
jgi:hypothetical protein